MSLNILNVLECKLVSGGLSKLDITDNILKFTVTYYGPGHRSVKINLPWSENENVYNIYFYPKKVTDIYGNTIFSGQSGSFTFNGYTFLVSPVHLGAIYELTEPFMK